MSLGDTNLILCLPAKRLFALKLLSGRYVHKSKALLLRQVLFQRVVWMYWLVCCSSVTSRILQDDLFASRVLL